MKTNNENSGNGDPKTTLTTLCIEWCRKVLGQIENVKDGIEREYSSLLGARGHLLRLALNEAEALAWQTDYPQLVFATLAEEKADQVAAWHHRQDSLLNSGYAPALAA